MKSKIINVENYNIDISGYSGTIQLIIGGGVALSFSKDGWNEINVAINKFAEMQEENQRLENIINNYSSASSRAENEHERGISAGIEMFRKYLLKELE